MLAGGLAIGLIELFASNIGLAQGPGFGWTRAVILMAALLASGVGLVIAYVPPTMLNPRAIVGKIGGSTERGGRRRLYFVVAGFLLGLAIRVAFIGHYGTEDADIFLGWGRDVASSGLAEGYRADYLPLQFQIFGSISALADHFGIRTIVALKAVNIVCDLGIFAVAIILLQRWAINPAYALVYWLTPYVAGLDWLSYVDFQLGLAALLAVLVISFGTRPIDFFVAGIPLAAAFLMKPQAYTLFGMLGLFVLARAIVERRTIGLRRWLLVFVAPIAMLGCYSLYFSINGHSLTFMIESLVGVNDVQPVLSGNQPNLWYLVGHFYQVDGAIVTGPAIYDKIAAIATVAILTFFAIQVARTAARRSDGVNMLLLFAVGALVVPMTMTQAHDNHLFLAAVFGSLIMVLALDRRFTVALSVLLALEFLNLFAGYGFDNPEPAWNPIGWSGYYKDPARFCVAVLVTATFAYLALQLTRVARSVSETR